MDKPRTIRSKTISLTYTVRRSDIASMYLGSWGARIAMVPGVMLILIGIPTNPQSPMAVAALFVCSGLVLVLAAPLLLCWMLMQMYRTDEVVGKSIRLTIDEFGVRGWPLASHIDTTWPRMRKARRFRGVVTLPFRQFGTRAGWVPVPEREMTAQQLSDLSTLLQERGC